MEEHLLTPPALEPLDYHRDVVDFLKENERAIWEWAASHGRQAEEIEATRNAMLQATYRLEAAAHPRIHNLCGNAMSALAIDAPVTLYQASAGEMNACLCFIPNEIHIIFYGDVLEKLSPEELTALLGHELAHFRLWSLEDGAFYIANSVLEHALAYPNAQPSHVETWRLYALCSEFFSDRGAAVSGGCTGPAISTLVKMMTGIGSVDAESYLRQAAELDKTGSASQGVSHPEVYLRAQALDKWWNQDPELETWIEQRLRGALSLGRLDLARQQELTELTSRFFTTFMANLAFQSDHIVTQIRRFFPNWTADGARLGDAALSADKVDDSIREYFIALILDLAMADQEVRDEVLAAGAKAAKDFGGLEPFKTALKRDLKLTKAATDRIVARIEGGAN